MLSARILAVAVAIVGVAGSSGTPGVRPQEYDCPVPEGPHNEETTVYQFYAKMPDGSCKSLAEYDAPILIIVNTASRCAYAPQLGILESLYRRNYPNLEVLAFPTNHFFNQEPGNDEQVQTLYKTMWNVTFPVFAKAWVNGPHSNPLFEFLKFNTTELPKKANWNPLQPYSEKDVQWNFEKFFIVGGKPVKRFSMDVLPSKIQKEIDATVAMMKEMEGGTAPAATS